MKTSSKSQSKQRNQRRKNNKIKARETRKRKKNYLSELEDKVAKLEIENHKLQEEVMTLNQKLAQKELGP